MALEGMDDKDAADLRLMLSERGGGTGGVFYSTLADVLKRRGIPVKSEALSRHARELCGCFR